MVDTFRRGTRKSLCIDFDGVIHSYTSPWTTPAEVRDGPVPGAIDFVNEMAGIYDVVILSSRAQSEEGLQAMEDWMVRHGVDEEFFEMGFIKITATKVGAIMYIDDRGYHFTGTFPTADEIAAFKPWNRRD